VWRSRLSLRVPTARQLTKDLGCPLPSSVAIRLSRGRRSGSRGSSFARCSWTRRPTKPRPASRRPARREQRTCGSSIQRPANPSSVRWRSPKRCRPRGRACSRGDGGARRCELVRARRQSGTESPPAAPLASQAAREAAREVVAPAPIELCALADAHLLASGDLLFGGGARTAIWISPLFFLRFRRAGELQRTVAPHRDDRAHDA